MSLSSHELVSINCLLCGAGKSSRWGDENGFHAVKCDSCGLVYVNPRPQADNISEANKIGQHKTHQGALDVNFRRSARKVAYYEKRIRKLFAREIQTNKPLTWLDVGAGYGELVEALQHVLPKGSVIRGIEPMAGKVMVAKQLGLPVEDTRLADLQERFDFVSMINVLSHLPDVDHFLREISQCLVPGGCLLMETGNGGDLATASDYPDLLYLPDHLVFAGVEHASAFLTRAGFSEIVTVSERRDTLTWQLKNVVKRMSGRQVRIGLPYTSSFRTVFFKSRLA